MQITKVEQQKNGYLVNEAIFVPQAEQNADYQAIQKWIADGGTVETQNLLLEAKVQKISEIKAARDQKNIEPITEFSAFVLDDEGKKTSQKSYFLFYTNRHQTNPNSDPDSIIARVLDLGAMPYFTKDLNGNKIAVDLTLDIAKSLRLAICQRNDTNYKISSSIEVKITDASTLEEVEAIGWSE